MSFNNKMSGWNPMMAFLPYFSKEEEKSKKKKKTLSSIAGVSPSGSYFASKRETQFHYFQK